MSFFSNGKHSPDFIPVGKFHKQIALLICFLMSWRSNDFQGVRKRINKSIYKICVLYIRLQIVSCNTQCRDRDHTDKEVENDTQLKLSLNYIYDNHHLITRLTPIYVHLKPIWPIKVHLKPYESITSTVLKMTITGKIHFPSCKNNRFVINLMVVGLKLLLNRIPSLTSC